MREQVSPSTFVQQLKAAVDGGHPEVIAELLKGDAARDVLAGLTDAEITFLFDGLSGNRSTIQAKLRALALALVGIGEHRLQVRAWESALHLGMDAGNAYNRMFDAQIAAGDSEAALKSGGKLLKIGRNRPNLSSILRDLTNKYVLEGDEEGTGHRADLAMSCVGLEFVEPVLAALAARGALRRETIEAALKDAADVDVGLRLLMLARTHALPFADLVSTWIAGLPDHGELVLALADALTALRDRDQARTYAMLELAWAHGAVQLPTTVAARWAVAAAMCGHPSLPAVASEIANSPAIASAVKIWHESFAAPEDVWIAYEAVARAGADDAVLAEAALSVGLQLNDELARRISELIAADRAPPSNQKAVSFVRTLVESPQVSGSFTAAFCWTYFDVLATTVQGASLSARAFSAANDWERSLRALDALIALTPNSQWAVGRAYLIAARLGKAEIAAGYLAKLDQAHPGNAPALLSVAHGAALLGDFEAGRRALAALGADGSDNDPHNLAGRLHALLTGNGALLSAGGGGAVEVSSTSSSPEVLLIDPGFGVDAGHHVGYSLFAIDFFSSQLEIDRSAVWLCTGRSDGVRGSGAEVFEENLHRLFDFNPYRFEEFPKTPRGFENLASAWEFDLKRAFSTVDLRSVRLIYCHSMKANMIAGFARWIKHEFGDREQPIALIIGVIEVDYLTEGDTARDTCDDAYVAGVEILRSIPNVSLVFYAETEFATSHLTKLLGDRAAVSTIPYLAASLAGDGALAPLALEKREITVGLVGGSRLERGIDVFPELMLSFAAQPRLRWIVQLDRRFAAQLDPAFPLFMEWAAREGICTWHDGRMDTEEYYDALRQMDVVLMPYRDRYAVSGSGVFYEAMQLQRLLMVPKGTFMAEEVAKLDYPAVVMGGTSLKSVRRSVRQMLDEVTQLRGRMKDFRASGVATLPLERFRALVRESLRSVEVSSS